MSTVHMRKPISISLIFSPAGAIALVLLFGCPNPAVTPPAPSTGGIIGYARYTGQSDNSGIIISVESVDGSGRTLSVMEAINKGGGMTNMSIAAHASTDASGAYSISELAPGTYTIYASSQNSLERAVTTGVTVTAGQNVTAAELYLTPTGQISGQVTLNGASRGNLGIIVFIAGTSYAAATEDSGAYTISSVPVGTAYLLVASKSGYGDATTNVDVTAGQTTTASGLNLNPIPVNHAPQIQSIAIYPQPVIDCAYLECSATDEDSDPLTYSWTIGGIPGIALGGHVQWKSAGIPGWFQVGVTVSDGRKTVSGTSAMNLGSANPWPKFRGNLQGTGVSPIASTAVGTSKWSYSLWDSMDHVYSSPAIGADGTIYFGTYLMTFFALNPDGTMKWAMGHPTLFSSPAVGADGIIYFGSDHKLYAVNPNGTEKWSYTTGDNVYSSPAIGADGTVYVGSCDGKLYAINPNGTFKWSYATDDPIIYAAPAIGTDGTVYIGSEDHRLYAINPDGTCKWSYITGGMINSSPAIGVDGTIYFGSNDHKVYAINPNGTLKWSYTTGSVVDSSPAIAASGTIYIGAVDGSGNTCLTAINPDGTLKWNFISGIQFGDPFSSPVIGADGTIYISLGYLYAINPSGSVKWASTSGSSYYYSSPAIGADGTIYVGSWFDNFDAIQ
jgi:outer membrane protein assembly factor BamB